MILAALFGFINAELALDTSRTLPGLSKLHTLLALICASVSAVAAVQLAS
jgi:hypothetical protein